MASAKKVAPRKAAAKKVVAKKAPAKKAPAKSARATAPRDGVNRITMTMAPAPMDDLDAKTARSAIKDSLSTTTANLVKLTSLVSSVATGVDTSLATPQGKALREFLLETKRLTNALQHRIAPAAGPHPPKK